MTGLFEDTLEVLLRIHREVLDVPDAAGEDNFFDLGGNSLLCMQITSRISEAFGVRVPAKAVFTAVTIRDLADRATAVRQGAWS